MKIHADSCWSKQEIYQYLDHAKTPLRLSCVESDGHPVICSLWFKHDEGLLWAACHKNSHIIKCLKNNNKVAVEVAGNEIPYQGVRGKATVELIDDEHGNVLSLLIDKYLQGSNQPLANWLLSRKKNEYAIKITPIQLNAWDFSERMTPI